VFTRGATTITGSSFTGNQAIATPAADGVNTTGSAFGGAIDNEVSPGGTTLIVSGSQFTGNRAMGGGGNVGGNLPGGFLDGGGFGGAIRDEEQANLIILDSALAGTWPLAAAAWRPPRGAPLRAASARAGPSTLFCCPPPRSLTARSAATQPRAAPASAARGA